MASLNLAHAEGATALAESPENLQSDQAVFAIEEFLASEETKDLLRFSTAGSVDDGKSTLIGRLLYDSRNVYEDQVRAVTGPIAIPGQKHPPSTSLSSPTAFAPSASRASPSTSPTATSPRSVASSSSPTLPATSSTPATWPPAPRPQTSPSFSSMRAKASSRSHAGTPTSPPCSASATSSPPSTRWTSSISQRRSIGKIEADFASLVKQFGTANLVTIPVSALHGDNVVEPSSHTPWYNGPTLLEHLEQVPAGTLDTNKAFRLPVQRVIRPDHTYRGFAGQIAAGTIRKGDEIIALPSGRRSRVASITTFDGDLDEAVAPQSIAITLEEELDISRGDVIADPARPPQTTTEFEAALVWFDGVSTRRPQALSAQARHADAQRSHHPGSSPHQHPDSRV